MAVRVPSFLSASAVATALPGTSVVVTKPAQTVAGVILLTAVTRSTSNTITPPAGWNLIDAREVAGGRRLAVYYKIATDSEPANYTWSVGSSDNLGGYCLAYRGVERVTVVDTSANTQTASTSTPNAASVTTSEDNAMIVACFAATTAAPTFTAGGGYTERADGTGQSAVDGLKATAGATGGIQVTASVADVFLAVTVALLPGIAERLYFPASGSAAITPAYSTEWDRSDQATRLPLVKTKSNTALATTSAISEATGSTSNLDHLWRQYVSADLVYGTVSGPFTAQLRVTESNAGGNHHAQIIVRLVDTAGANPKVLFAGDLQVLTGNPTNEFGTTLANRHFPRVATARTLTPQDAHAGGSRLVVEIGAREHNTSTTVYTNTVSLGDPTATGDLPEDDTTTTALCPWIEFADGLQWTEGQAGITGNLTSTLAASTLTGAAAVAVAGSSTSTLTASTATGAGAVSVSGSSTSTLTAGTVTATAGVRVTGQVDSTLAASTLEASATVGPAPITGTVTSTLAASTLTAAGTVAVTGTQTSALAPNTLTASAAVGVSGTTTATLTASTVTASGAVQVAATATHTLNPSTATGSGSVAVTGSTTATLGASTLDAGGAVAVTGTLTSTLAPSTLDASVSVGSSGAITGNLTATLAPSTLTASGSVGVSSTVSSTLTAGTVTSSATVGIAGAMVSTLTPSTLDAGAGVQVTGTLTANLNPGTGELAAAVTVTGTVSAVLAASTLTASVTVETPGALTITFVEGRGSCALLTIEARGAFGDLVGMGAEGADVPGSGSIGPLLDARGSLVTDVTGIGTLEAYDDGA